MTTLVFWGAEDEYPLSTLCEEIFELLYIAIVLICSPVKAENERARPALLISHYIVLAYLAGAGHDDEP